MKSSIEARRLIRATLKKFDGNQHRAARALGLPTQAQLSKMLKGTLKDTPAMKAALLRAQRRADRAYYRVDDQVADGLDCRQVSGLLAEIDDRLNLLRAMCAGTTAAREILTDKGQPAASAPPHPPAAPPASHKSL